MKCVAKIMAMPGIRTAVTDLCMFRLPACDERGSGFVNVSVRTVTNARRVGVRLQSKCASAHRHAQVNTNSTTEKGERTGTWVRQVAQAIEEQLKEDHWELKTRERKRKVEDAKRIRRIVHENNKNKELSGEKRWNTFVSTRCTQGSPEKRAYVRREGYPSRQGGRRPTRGNQGSPMCARGGSRRSTRRTQGQNCTRQHRHSRR